ncbi:MAG: Fic family protein [Zoogloeaceae bacterium]|jgi:cell filamentation protein|nr:Fic family protein [Zoogloeaceae bacterium]
MMADSWKAYFWPNSEVLKNKLMLFDAEALREAEYQAIFKREKELNKNPIKGNFDMAHLKACHKHLFQDVYGWAGELRTVDMAKGGTPFAHFNYLDSAMRDIHKRLEKDNFLRGLERKDFVDGFTDVYGDMNALHPFREGNGRATRCFMRALANQAGYEFDYSRIESDHKQRWNEASKQSAFGKMDELRAILDDAILPLRGEG